MSLVTFAKYVFAPVLYRFPPIGLQPSELGIYLIELLNRKDICGDVAEIGCHMGGTACIASELVRKYSPHKNYICYDTFSGFVREQFDADIARGTPESMGKRFSANSYGTVRRILNLHGGKDVRLVAGDIVTVPDDQLSQLYSVVLVDVDLAEPTYIALKRFFPRLSSGGIILVDDCRPDPEQVWRAQEGYQRFCQEAGFAQHSRFGFGIIEKP